MGDRSNVVVIHRLYGADPGATSRIYLYGHWMGEENIAHAVHGLESGRSTDAEYLTRVIFSDMVKNDIASETGYGISPQLTDNEHPIVVIDPEEQKVWLENDGGSDDSPHVDYATFIAAAAETKDVPEDADEDDDRYWRWGTRLALKLTADAAAREKENA